VFKSNQIKSIYLKLDTSIRLMFTKHMFIISKLQVAARHKADYVTPDYSKVYRNTLTKNIHQMYDTFILSGSINE